MKKTVAACLAVLFLCLAGCADSEEKVSINLQQTGLSGVMTLLEEQIESTRPALYRLISFSGDIDSNAVLGDFLLTVEGYDAGGASLGVFGLQRTGEALLYTSPKENGTDSAPYNANTDVFYISGQICRLPLVSQLDALNAEQGRVNYHGSARSAAGDPVIDGRSGEDFPVLTAEAYQSGSGGLGDGKTAVQIGLQADDLNLIYLCPLADESTLVDSRNPGDRQQREVTEDGLLRFSGDYGETWIPCDITPEQVEDALAVYPDGILPAGEFYVSEEEPYTAAFLYGAQPHLYITRDSGESWNSYPVLPDTDVSELGYSARAVRFFDVLNGYVAIGTDWSMGHGGARIWRVTHDGGRHWETQSTMNFPGGESDCLSGISFVDFEHGVISVQGPPEYQTEIYTTADGGATWTRQELTDAYGYVLNLQELDGVYQFEVKLSRTGKRHIFRSEDMISGWERAA